MGEWEIEVGDQVRILNYKLTDSLFTATSEMRLMVGQVVKVTNISPSLKHPGESCIAAGGWNWAASDLELVMPNENKPKPETFNIDNLIL